MFFLTPRERRAVIFCSGIFFCGVCLDIVFKLYPPGYQAMDVLDHPPEKPLVDINRATYEELLNVKGIGPSSAARILYARQERGRFATVQELRRIKGFSKRMFERARPFLVAGPP